MLQRHVSYRWTTSQNNQVIGVTESLAIRNCQMVLRIVRRNEPVSMTESLIDDNQTNDSMTR